MCTASGRLRLLHVSCVALLCGVPAGSGASASSPLDRHDARATTQTAAAIDPALPRATSDLWFVPDSTYRPSRLERDALLRLASGINAFRSGKYGDALILLSRRGLPSSAANYASYYAGLSRLRLGQVEVARKELSILRARQPVGYLSDATDAAEADAALAMGDHAGARNIYELLVKRTTATPDQTWLKLARTSLAVGDQSRAIEAYRRIYEDFSLSPAAVEAESWLESAGVIPPLSPGNTRHRSARKKADALFDAKRYEAAQRGYERLLPYAGEPDRAHLAIRGAACDYFLRRHAAARQALRPYVTDDPARPDARFVDLMSARALGRDEDFARLAYAFVARFPTDSNTAEVLDALATYHIRRNEDERADVAFRNVLSSFAGGPFGARASWHVGWRAYRSRSQEEAAELFEAAAARFPRSDYRPAYLYWAARARASLGQQDRAAQLYALVSTDYRHSYYGQLAATRDSADPARRASLAVAVAHTDERTVHGTSPPTAELIRTLLYAGLYDEAMTELQYAQRTRGDIPALRATQAWIESRNNNLLAGSNAMKRAYPHYLMASADALPSDLLAVIYPLGFWSLLQQHARQHAVDPYVLAALVAQESSFIPDIRSSARATGLMQLMPGTAARYARRLGVPATRTLLTRPETNVRLGTAYFADLVREFGEVHLALASYNAGENRVRRWLAARRDLSRDEFIDDIPFPETRMYVKKILGAAENYRRIYGSGAKLGIDPNRTIPGLASRAATPHRESPHRNVTSRMAPAGRAPAAEDANRPKRATLTKTTVPAKPLQSPPTHRSEQIR